MDVRLNSATFLAANCSYQESSTVIIGCPLDITTTFRPGTRFAPGTVREVSWGLETYSLLQDRDLEDLKICDVGDLELPFGNTEGALETIQRYVAAVAADKKFPVLIGGEHLLTLGVVKELSRQYVDVVVVQIDAHADLRETYLGEHLSHATVMRRIADVVGEGSICQLGVRSATRDEIRYAKQIGSLCEVEEVVNRVEGRPVYVTVDLDVLDPAVAPGVSTPEPGGLTFDELISMLTRLQGLGVIGCDVVELSPTYDPTQQSAIAAAKVIRELILQFGRKKGIE